MFLRYGLRDRQRTEAFLRLIRELARGKAFGQRISFVLVAHKVGME